MSEPEPALGDTAAARWTSGPTCGPQPSPWPDRPRPPWLRPPRTSPSTRSSPCTPSDGSPLSSSAAYPSIRPGGGVELGPGEITSASAAFNRSFATASDRMHKECARAGGHGVVGVHVEWAVHRHHIDVALLGTAIRPVASKRIAADSVFVSDLSGPRFHAPPCGRLGAPGPGRGVELRLRAATDGGRGHETEITERRADQLHRGHVSARESAMERMQQSALSMRGEGVVEVKVTEDPWTSPITPWALRPTAPSYG